MNVGELKQLLEKYPDQLEVIGWDAGDPTVGIQEGTYDVESVAYWRDDQNGHVLIMLTP